MKKISRIFLLILGVFVFSGCCVKEVVTDTSSLTYLNSDTKENIAYNLNLAMRELKSTRFSGNLKVKEDEYYFTGEIIVGETIENSLIHINYKNNDLYLKKENLYVKVSYKDINVVVKDKLDIFVNEIVELLGKKGVESNKEKIIEIIKEKRVGDINYNEISEFIEKKKNGFEIEYKNYVAEFNESYLPTSFYLIEDDVSLNIDFNYEKVSIEVPFEYDLLNFKLEEIKDFLEIGTVSELIK